MKIIELSNCKVEIVENLTWGMREAIKEVMMSGFAVTNATGGVSGQSVALKPEILTKTKYKALEICVKKVIYPDGKEKPYSKDWMDNLSVEDGEKLYEAVDTVSNQSEVKKN